MKHSYVDKYSDIDSCIHTLDPRLKILITVIFILSIIFTKPTSFLSFALYALFVFVLILLSKIPIGFVFRQSLVIIPFTLMVAVFIPFFKSGQVAGAYSFGTLHLTITYEGLMIFWNVLIKAYLSVLYMIVLTASTKFSNLLKAFESLKCPKLIIMIISFMYRYIYVLIDELMRMKRAKDSRLSFGAKKLYKLRVLANMIGVLFIRAYERGERVYLAMCSRGFDGKIKTLRDFGLKKADFCFLLIAAILLVAIRSIGT